MLPIGGGATLPGIGGGATLPGIIGPGVPSGPGALPIIPRGSGGCCIPCMPGGA
jgi:hypothetical protein